MLNLNLQTSKGSIKKKIGCYYLLSFTNLLMENSIYFSIKKDC